MTDSVLMDSSMSQCLGNVFYVGDGTGKGTALAVPLGDKMCLVTARHVTEGHQGSLTIDCSCGRVHRALTIDYTDDRATHKIPVLWSLENVESDIVVHYVGGFDPRTDDIMRRISSAEVYPGEPCWVVGFPLGIKPPGVGDGHTLPTPIVKQCHISAILSEGQFLLDTQVVPGMSGSPVVSMRMDRIVGFVTGSELFTEDGENYEDAGLSVATPSGVAHELIEELLGVLAKRP